ncbi:unnamed protein product [Brassica rapa subsp. trilocularis]
MNEMETKTQVEDSIIQESLLTCIDLANSDHQSCSHSYVFFIFKGITKKVTTLDPKFPEMILSGIIHSMAPTLGLILANVLPGWREAMEKYHQEALRVCKAIAKLLALALDMDADYFDSPEMLGKPITTLRLLHYEGKSDPSKGIYGTGAHSDYGMMTLIATDGVLGLQICKDRNAKPQKWEYVPSIEGALVVNLGDMMQCWSNGLFRSTMHRVILNDQNRYSIPFFLEPNHDCIIECLPTCQSESNLPKYPAIKCSTYITQRYEEVHANFRSYEKHA